MKKFNYSLINDQFFLITKAREMICSGEVRKLGNSNSYVKTDYEEYLMSTKHSGASQKNTYIPKATPLKQSQITQEETLVGHLQKLKVRYKNSPIKLQRKTNSVLFEFLGIQGENKVLSANVLIDKLIDKAYKAGFVSQAAQDYPQESRRSPIGEAETSLFDEIYKDNFFTKTIALLKKSITTRHTGEDKENTGTHFMFDIDKLKDNPTMGSINEILHKAANKGCVHALKWMLQYLERTPEICKRALEDKDPQDLASKTLLHRMYERPDTQNLAEQIRAKYYPAPKKTDIKSPNIELTDLGKTTPTERSQLIKKTTQLPGPKITSPKEILQDLYKWLSKNKHHQYERIN